MRLLPSLAAGLFVTAVSVACSDSAAEPGGATSAFPASALVTASSDSGALSFELRTGPAQPPSRGTCDVEYRIVDAATGQPVDGLALDVVPWMVTMGHGSSGKPTVTAKGDGRYVARDVSLYMPGRWELRTTVGGPRADRAAPALDVQ
jgi:hypothetical protein